MAEDDRKFINTAQHNPAWPFSDGVLVNDTLYLSGRIGIDPQTGIAPADVRSELKFLFDGVEEVLRRAGMTMNDLVYVQIFSPDVSLWNEFNQAYVQRFSRELPARAFIGSGPLLLGARFEMIGIAIRPRK
ncbi:MAG TPA: Rid family hydrolase [Terriglobales bacterium]